MLFSAFRAFRRAVLPAGRNDWLLFLAGINLMLLNFILVQHITVAIRNDEIAVIVFSLSFFAGISLGYFMAGKISRTWIRRLLPVFLVGQMLVLVLVQVLVYVISNDMGDWAEQHGLPEETGLWAAYAFIFTWTTLGATSMYSVFLPAVIESEDGQLRRCYSIEIAGSLLGLLLIPLLAGLSHAWLLAGYFVVFIGIAVLLGTPRSLLAAMSLLIVVYMYSYDSWDKQGAEWFYKRRYANNNVQGVAFTHHTPYHKIEVLELDDNEYMLLLNGKRQFARGSHFTYSYFVAEYPARLLGAPTVCLLGCGSMSTVGRIGDFVPEITIVDLDPAVFTTSKRFFSQYNHLDELNNWTFYADDAKHYMANSKGQFDLIMHDIPPARSRQTALTYTYEFFMSVKERLTPRGMFSIAALNSRSSASKYGLKMIATLARVFDHYFILSYGDSYYFYGGGTGMQEYDRQTLLEAIDHAGKNRVRVLDRAAIDALVKDITIITTNNVGDLIYD